MIKALFFDLDGTLLNPDKEISHKTRKTLEKCKESSIGLYIATARPPLLDRMLSWDASTLSLFDGGSYYNGGCVILGALKTYSPVSEAIVQKTIEQVCRYGTLNIALQLEHEKHAFRFPLEEKGWRTWGVSADETLALNQVGNLQTIKMLVFFSNLIDSDTPISTELVQGLERLCLGAAQFYLTDKGKCVQIMAESVNKLSSIEKMRAALGYEKNEIAVFGDDINDMEMLSGYEYSVAMGNAGDRVKGSAQYVTLDNNHDGIHHAICDILHLVD